MLNEKNDAIAFQREMYNLTSMLESIVNKLDKKRCHELVGLKQDASDMNSLHTNNSWNKTNKSRSKGGRMDSIPEEDGARGSGKGKGAHGSKPKDEEDFGVFDSDNIRAALSQMNYKVAYVAYNVCAPSIT
jgi:hypothetical protein